MKFYVYDFLGSNDTQLYIGSTDDLARRFTEHRENKPDMWNEHVKILVNEFKDKKDALAYENIMVVKHSPKYNKEFNYHSSLKVVDTRHDNWRVFNESIFNSEYMISDDSTIVLSKQRNNSKYRDRLCIQKIDGIYRFKGNGSLDLTETEFHQLIDEMVNLEVNGEYKISQPQNKDKKSSDRNNSHRSDSYKSNPLENLNKLKEKRITKPNN